MSVHDITDRLSRVPGGGGGGDEPPMSTLETRVGNLERDVDDIKLTLARIEGRFDSINARFDSMVTWKAAFAGLAVLTLGLMGVVGTVIGAAWWMAQQYLSPLLQAAGAS